MAAVINWDSTDGATTTFHERAIAATPTVRALRTSALEVVQAMLVHSDVSVRRSAATILQQYTVVAGGGMTSSTPGLKKFQAAEFRKLAPFLEKRISEEADISVLATIEEGLVFRWAAGRPGAEDAGRILQTATWPSLLTAFRLTTKPWEFYFSILEAMRGAPAVNRWSWWVDQRSFKEKRGLSFAEVDRVIDVLSAEFPGPEGLASVAQALNAAPRLEILLDRWCRRDPKRFRLTLDRQSDQLSEGTRHKLERALRRTRFSAASFDPVAEIRHCIDAREPHSTLEEVCNDFPPLTLETAEAITSLLANDTATEVRRLGLQILQYRSDVPHASAFRTIKTALRDGQWNDSWQIVWSLFHNAEHEAQKDPELLNTLEERLVETLHDDNWHSRGNDEWHIEQVLEIVAGRDTTRRERLVTRLATADSAWRTPVTKLAAPLLSNATSLESLLRKFAHGIAREELTIERCRQLITGSVTETNLPSNAMILTKRLLDDASLDLQRLALMMLAEMRETALAAESCAFLADLQAGGGPLAKDADHALHRFTMPRGGYSGAVGKAPPKLLQIQAMLTQAATKVASTDARKRINSMWREVEKRIEDDLKRDAEVMDER